MTSVDDFKSYTDIEHVRQRPDMWIGSIQNTTEERWVIETENENFPTAEKSEIQYNPGLEQCILELITNATDHAARCEVERVKDSKITPVTQIKVSMDDESICIWNDGQGIPIKIEKKSGLYIPEMIFGNLRTSSNYDDDKKKTWGGKNGIGAKAANIFSTKFVIEVQTNGKNYKQVFSNGMTKRKDPVIKDKKSKDYVKINYFPDFEAFGMKDFQSNLTRVLVEKRCYDASAATGKSVGIWFNKKKIPVKDFSDYMKLYIGNEKKVVYNHPNGRWEVGFAVCPYEEPTQISFVNAVCTDEGGSHVNHVLNPVLDSITAALQSKAKDVTIRKQYIRDNVIIFIKALIENPSFNSQLKRKLDTKVSDFGSRCDIPDDVIKKIAKLGITDNVLEIAKAKEMKKAIKVLDGTKKVRLTDIKKLSDANWAGTKKSDKCTLILTEGDSASGLALNGITAAGGRDCWGVFPLRGKFLNVRTATAAQLMKNEEMLNINRILGLKEGLKDISKLRYHRVMCLTDQDSVAGDTPLLLRENGQIVIKNIEDVTDSFKSYSPSLTKEYGKTDCEVWTDQGWTTIKHIMRHKVTKKMYRVLTHSGCVDVTEDHSLLNENCEEITPNEIKVGNTLLHNFPLFEENKIDIPEDFEKLSVEYLQKIASSLKIRYRQRLKRAELINVIKKYKNTEAISLVKDIDVSEDESWVMGLFLADGTCGYYEFQTKYKNKNRPKAYTHNRKSWNWSITNTDLKLLEKSKETMTKIYGDYFKILKIAGNPQYQINTCYKLILNGGKKIQQPVVEKYRRLFYYKKFKYIHPDILNASKKIRENIFNGYYAGDGVHDLNAPMSMDINSKITSQCIYFLVKSLGYETSINHNPKKPNVYTISVTKGTLQKNPCMIKKIIELPHEEQYVYDLETENHHFNAGIGSLIVHNTDGFHIKGLLINYFTFNWPELVEQGLIECLITPVIKVFKGMNTLKQFYNVDDYRKWEESTNHGKVRVKYYKGLGTSSKEEAKDYFKNLENNRIYYQFKKKDVEKMVLAFDKEHADNRKKWITKALKEPQEIDYNQKKVPVDYFVDRELVLFSIYDNERSIPNIIDGLKPSQRKILYACLKRKLFRKEDGSGEIKVAQLSGYVSEHAAYHHGEASLQSTITSMAQEFVGSGNLNVLFPSGNFGSRNQGGKDAASARYIFTYLRDYVKILFNETDNKLLDYLEDDGVKIEPKFYVPIIPLILLNGSSGIGTGWSTDMPCFNINDIISNIRLLLDDEDAQIGTMHPWYKGFKGTIVKNGPKSWTSSGKIRIYNANTVEVIEIPVGMWKQDFKEYLDKLVDEDKIVNVTSHEKDGSDDICFRIRLKNKVSESDLPQLSKLFKLEKSISGSNMVAFNERCVINKYGSAEDILWDFYKYRLHFYQKRKDFLEKELEDTIEIINERVKFVRMVVDDQIIVFKKPKDVIEQTLIGHGFVRRTELMSMGLHKFTKEEIDKLEKQLEDLNAELITLKSKTKKDLWKEDLEKLENALSTVV